MIPKASSDPTMPLATAEGPFNWEDPLGLNDLLSDEERLVAESTREFCQNQLMPRVLEMHRHESFDRAIMNEFGERSRSNTAAPDPATSPMALLRARLSGSTPVFARP